MITDQKEFFPESALEMSLPEVVKYLARFRDEYWSLDPRPSFNEWLSDRVYDPGERLRFAGALFVATDIAKILAERKKILKITVSPGPNHGDVHWDICCEAQPTVAGFSIL
jgi:hypothetical protein